MSYRTCAALLGGLLLPLALLAGSGPADATPEVEAELSRLIAGYAASGQEGLDALDETQQQTLAKCAADTLGELPAEDMAVLTAGQDLGDVLDTIGPRFEDRAGEAAGVQLMSCFIDAMMAAEQSTGTGADATLTADLSPAEIDAEYMASFQKVLRDSEPPSEAAVGEMVTCMSTTLAPVMSTGEKREAIDTSFSEEIGRKLAQAHPAEFDQFMACAEQIAGKYE